MYIRIVTGGDKWATIHLENEQTAIETAAQYVAYAKERWPNERTRIEGNLSEEKIETIKNLAKKLL